MSTYVVPGPWSVPGCEGEKHRLRPVCTLSASSDQPGFAPCPRPSRLCRRGSAWHSLRVPAPHLALQTERRTPGANRPLSPSRLASVPTAPSPAAGASAGSRQSEAEGAWPEAPSRDRATSREAAADRESGAGAMADWARGERGIAALTARGRPSRTPPCAGARPWWPHGEPLGGGRSRVLAGPGCRGVRRPESPAAAREAVLLWDPVDTSRRRRGGRGLGVDGAPGTPFSGRPRSRLRSGTPKPVSLSPPDSRH